MVRFQALDRCFSDTTRYYFIEDLVNACNRALRENGMPEVSKRTVQYDIVAMEGNHRWKVLLMEPEHCYISGKRYFRYEDPSYSIWKDDLSEQELNQLKTMVLMLGKFKGLPQFEKMQELVDQLAEKYHFTIADSEQIIGFDTNEFVGGIEHLNTLFNAIVHQQTLKLSYQPFGKEANTIIVHPYYIKQYNNRWFLFGHTDGYESISIWALDRILQIDPCTVPYEKSTVDFEDYFDDFVGVTCSSTPVEDVRLQFSPRRFPYVVSKPLHHSQKIIDREQHIIQISVRPNYELIQTLLSFGADVKIIEPATLSDKISKIIAKMCSLYSVMQTGCTTF